MKKIISILLSLGLCVFMLTGCEYEAMLSDYLQNGIDTGSEVLGDDGTSDKESSDEGATSEKEDVSTVERRRFTVNLICDGQPYSSQSLIVNWINGTEVVSSFVNSEGVAIAYMTEVSNVFLENLPEGYTYDKFACFMPENKTELTVRIYPLNKTYDTGEDLYETIIDIDKTGAYRAVIEARDDVVYYQFQPRTDGVYKIESFIYPSETDMDLALNIYKGTSLYKFYDQTITKPNGKRFEYEFNLSQEIGNKIGNSFIFGISGNNQENKYPMTVEFLISRVGDYVEPNPEETKVYATEDFENADFTWETGKWTWAENGGTTLNADNFVLHTDGYYHFKDTVTGEVTDRKLYAMLGNSIDSRPIEPYNGQTVSLAILAEGSLIIGTAPFGNLNGRSYTDFVLEYAKYVNEDGVYPVTQEMVECLQAFAVAQKYFYNGKGWYEVNYGISAEENSQWLFCCGFYE